MAANTHASDVNEILFLYYMNGGSWSGIAPYVKKQLQEKMKKITKEEYKQQDGRAQIMAEESLKWAKSQKYGDKVKSVWWTARPGVIESLVEVDDRNNRQKGDNPTDVLVLFTSGKFLGYSAKSTRGKKDIGFKNPGIGTMDKTLKMNLAVFYKKHEDITVKKFKLPTSQNARKSTLRSNPVVQRKTEEIGSAVLSELRDMLLKKLKTLSEIEFRKHILSHWLNSDKRLYPPYAKVTGMGTKEPYSAKVEDPLKNEKLMAIGRGKFKLEKVGNESIGVTADGKKIMKIRFKFESEKMASSVKLSGESW